MNILKFEYLFSISILEDASTEQNLLDCLKKALTVLESATSSPPDVIRDVYFLAVTILVKLQGRSVLTRLYSPMEIPSLVLRQY